MFALTEKTTFFSAKKNQIFEELQLRDTSLTVFRFCR